MKIKLSESTLSEMIQKAVTKVLKEGIYDGYTEAGDNGDSSELSQHMNSVDNDLNMQAKYNDGSYNDRIISTNEVMVIAKKAGDIVLDAKDAIMELAYIYDEDGVPMHRVEEVLGEYDITLDELEDEGEIDEQDSNYEQSNINEYSNDQLYLETYIDGQQLMGSDGTIVIHNANTIALNNTINTRINTIKKLIPNVKPYIGKAKNITLKLVNGNNKVLKEFDITRQVLSELGQFTEAKTPKIIKVKLNELRQVITQIIKEEEEEAKSIDRRIPKIQRLVDEINHLISQAIDSDGEPIAVIDTTNTWQSPMVYNQIIYSKNGSLKISNSYPMEPRKGIETDIIRMRDMEFDGIPTLLLIRRLYKKALKQNINKQNIEEEAWASDGGYYSKPERDFN